MKYYFSKKINKEFEDAIVYVTNTLQKEGFGVVSEIDLQAKFKEKLQVDFRKYKILGVCNPQLAYKALQHEDKLGTMLPCNFIVQEIDEATTEIAAVDPVASMQAVENDNLAEVAQLVQGKLKAIVEQL